MATSTEEQTEMAITSEETAITENKKKKLSRHEPQSTLDMIAQIQSDAEDSGDDENNSNQDDDKNSNDPIPFSPTDFAKNNSELLEIIKLNSKENVQQRLYRLLVIIAFIVFLLPFTQGTKFQLLQCLAFGELFLMLGYAAHLFGILCKAHFQKETGLYRVYTLNSIPPKWAHMSISYRAILYKSQPLESISEFSAIQGGMASTMLFGTATATIIVIACAFAADIQYESFSLHGTDIAILFGAFGLVMIGTFELDPFNKFMIKLHYVGVALSVGIFIAFNWQIGRMLVTHDTESNCSIGSVIWYPILLDLFAIIGFLSWQISLKKGKNYQKYLLENIDNESVVKYDPYKISKFSIINLGSEGIFFIGAGLSLCSFLFFYPINKACRDDPSVCCTTFFPKLANCS